MNVTQIARRRIPRRAVLGLIALPGHLTVKRHQDLAGRSHYIWVRRAVLTLLAVLIALGLANVFGQAPTTSRAATPAAVLSVSAPDRVRGGLLYTVRFHVSAVREVKKALLVLDPGWVDGMQVNSVNPQPASEASRDGRLVFDLGHIAAGHSTLTFIEFQVNPTTIGRQGQNVELDDGPTRLMTIHRSITVFP